MAMKGKDWNKAARKIAKLLEGNPLVESVTYAASEMGEVIFIHVLTHAEEHWTMWTNMDIRKLLGECRVEYDDLTYSYSRPASEQLLATLEDEGGEICNSYEL